MIVKYLVKFICNLLQWCTYTLVLLKRNAFGTYLLIYIHNIYLDWTVKCSTLLLIQFDTFCPVEIMFMLSTSRQCAIRAYQIRVFSTTLKSAAANVPSTQQAAAKTTSDASATHKPSDMDKRYLVWSGKYKSTSEIPEYVQ